MSSSLSPAVLSTFQDVYMDKLVDAISRVGGYSLSLFYVIAALELGFFGLTWAIRQEQLFGEFFLKVLKLGFVFFVISEYPTLLQAIINGFTQIAFQVAPNSVNSLLFNPAEIWRYGFDQSIEMLKVSVQYGTTNTAMANVFLTLGLGSLFLFALVGIQIILAVVGFYLVSLVALLLIPFGGFAGTQTFLTRALEGVFKAGVRVFVVIILVGGAVAVWASFPQESMTMATTFDRPLSLTLSVLIVALLIWKLPEMAAQLVGEIRNPLQPFILGSAGGSGTPSVNVSAPLPVNSVAVGTQTGLAFGVSNMNSGGTTSGSNSPSSLASAVSVATPMSASASNLFDLTQEKRDKKSPPPEIAKKKRSE